MFNESAGTLQGKQKKNPRKAHSNGRIQLPGKKYCFATTTPFKKQVNFPTLEQDLTRALPGPFESLKNPFYYMMYATNKTYLKVLKPIRKVSFLLVEL